MNTIKCRICGVDIPLHTNAVKFTYGWCTKCDTTTTVKEAEKIAAEKHDGK